MHPDHMKTRLFLGFLISGHIKTALFDSSTWKQAKAMSLADGLVEVRHGGQDYIGRYVEDDKLSLGDVKKLENQIMQMLVSYAPQLSVTEGSCIVFAQLFVW
jgi:hypothetical protein